jgi:hypothetical protein
MYSFFLRSRPVRKITRQNAGSRRRRLNLEVLEDRALLATITQITTDAFDHRWPSINNNGDVVYSAQVAGLWEVFKLPSGSSAPVQLTSGANNKMFPALADNGDVVYFKDGGSSGIGWQVVRRSSSGSESQLQFSTRNVLTGAHRDANRYSGISSNGTSISGFNFFSSPGATPTRRFSADGVGQFAFDFGGSSFSYNYPDINAQGDIVLGGDGFSNTNRIYKTTTSGPFPGTLVTSTARMARINDGDDLVTVSGNLDAPGTIQIRTAPNYTQMTSVGSGSWADINNAKDVIFENLDAQNRRQVYLFRSAETDIEMLSAQLQGASAVAFTYETTGNPGPFQVGLFRSANESFDPDPTIDLPIGDLKTITPTSGQQSDTIALPALTPDPTRPFLLVVADPTNGITERDDDPFNEDNTVQLRMPDIEMSAAITRDLRSIEVKYSISGSPSPAFILRAYISSDATFDPGVDLPLPGQLGVSAEQDRVVNPPDTPHEVTMTLANKPVNDTHRFIIVVADPDGAVSESNESNNAVFAIPILTNEESLNRLGDTGVDESDATAAGPFRGPIVDGSLAFNSLKNLEDLGIWIHNSPFGYYSPPPPEREVGDRLVQDTLLEPTRRLVNLISHDLTRVPELWNSFSFSINEAYDVGPPHASTSRHKEARALDIDVVSTGTPGSIQQLGRLAGLAWLAGFDWVYLEGGTHVHLSERPSICLPGQAFTNVLLPQQEMEIALVKSTGLQLEFAPLGLNFMVQAPGAGEVCSAQSNVGTLVASIRNVATGEQHAVGYSTAQATLTLADSGNIHWHTSGFEVNAGSIFGIPIPVPLGTYGPFDFDVNVSTLGLSIDTDFETVVRTAEPYIHEQLSQQIFEPFTQILVIEDPGDTQLLVTGPSGQNVGMTEVGEVIQDIPGSAYFSAVPLALVVAPTPGIYETKVRGLTSGDYLLVTALVDGSQIVVQQSFGGTISAGQEIGYATTLNPASGGLDTVPDNMPPVVTSFASTLPPGGMAAEGQQVTVTGAFTDTGALDTHTASIDWGDGTVTAGVVTEENGAGTVAGSHIYTDGGEHVIEIEVTDNGTPPLSDTATFTMTVNNVPPSVIAGSDTTIPKGGAFSASGSFTDPGADAWTATVNYGDGSGDEPLALNSDKTFSLGHEYLHSGTFTVTVTVTDDDGGVGIDTATVQVLSEQEQLQVLIADVNALVAAGILNHGQGRSLNAKLEAATKKFNQGIANAALNELHAFVNHVNAFIKSRLLTNEQGQPLIRKVHDLVEPSEPLSSSLLDLLALNLLQHK